MDKKWPWDLELCCQSVKIKIINMRSAKPHLSAIWYHISIKIITDLLILNKFSSLFLIYNLHAAFCLLVYLSVGLGVAAVKCFKILLSHNFMRSFLIWPQYSIEEILVSIWLLDILWVCLQNTIKENKCGFFKIKISVFTNTKCIKLVWLATSNSNYATV